MHRAFCWLIFIGVISLSGTAVPLHAQGVDVSAKIILHPADKSGEAKHKDTASGGTVVLWLTPLQPGVARPAPAHQTAYRLVQKNKQFSPHLLVVPTGASVEFPNEDPFFHNVFSLFNGKQFALPVLNPAPAALFASIVKECPISSATFIRRWGPSCSRWVYAATTASLRPADQSSSTMFLRVPTVSMPRRRRAARKSRCRH